MAAAKKAAPRKAAADTSKPAPKPAVPDVATVAAELGMKPSEVTAVVSATEAVTFDGQTVVKVDGRWGPKPEEPADE